MDINLKIISQEAKTICEELIENADLCSGDILVLGYSSSEINGAQIGKASSNEVGFAVIDAILPIIREKGVYLAVQGCEHINRALVVEKKAANIYGLEIVNVVPSLNAGGACCSVAYERSENPGLVEHISAHAGIDIGDTFIGMHVRSVQVPVRVSIREIRGAHVTCLKSRPKLIGGERAQYSK